MFVEPHLCAVNAHLKTPQLGAVVTPGRPVPRLAVIPSEPPHKKEDGVPETVLGLTIRRVLASLDQSVGSEKELPEYLAILDTLKYARSQLNGPFPPSP